MAEDILRSGELVSIGIEALISRTAYREAVEAVTGRLKSAGGQGLKRSVLQEQTGLSAEVFGSALERIVADGTARVSGESVAIAGAAPAISAEEAQLRDVVAAAYRKAALAAPTVKEVAQQLRIGEAEMRRVITLMIRDKALVRMGSDDTFVHAEAVRALIERLKPMRGKTLDVAGFKALTGLTRKHAIPLLELLDRERIMRKQGDVRVVL